jgi:hypothetical protein
MFSGRYRPSNECVFTGDLAMIECTDLRELFKYGLKFRTKVRNPRILDTVANALKGFADNQSTAQAIDRDFYKGWIKLVVKKVSERVGLTPKHHGVPITPHARKYLKFLQHHLVIVPTDKAHNNASFVCKRLYQNTLLHELQNNTTYQRVNITPDQLLRQHQDFLVPKHLCTYPDKIGHLYATPKQHKPDSAYRFIASLPACTTTDMSRLITSTLSLVARTLRHKDDTLVQGKGIRRYFITEGYEETATWINNYSPPASTPRTIYSGDFSTLYTTISHPDLKQKIRDGVNEAISTWAEAKQTPPQDIIFSIDRDNRKTFTASWAQVPQRRTRRQVHMNSTAFGKHKITLDAHAFFEIFDFLIDNVYVANGNTLYRQSVGIPMGTNCGPVVANLYLYAYESKFIDGLIQNNQTETAKKFHTTFRFIDDVLSLDNNAFRNSRIYPPGLTLNETTEPNMTTAFIGMQIKKDQNKWTLDVAHKHFPFEVIRYPDMRSEIPTDIPYGVFLGLLYRFSRICTHKETFMEQIKATGATFLNKGCTPTRLYRTLNTFLGKQGMAQKTLHHLCGRFKSALRESTRHLVSPGI